MTFVEPCCGHGPDRMRVRQLDPTSSPALACSILLAGALGLFAADPGALRTVLAGTVAFLLIVAALRFPRSALTGLVVWLVALGLLRRLTSGVSPTAAWGDPLILVGSSTWIALTAVAVRSGALKRRSSLTNAVLLLATILGASAVNPLQGGLSVGLGGALLVVVPMSAFLIGRTLVDDRLLGRLLGLAAGLGIVCSLYGLFQTFVGLPSWDAQWVRNEGYTSLSVGGVIRPFSSFSAASDYAWFLGVSIIAWITYVHSRLRWPPVLAALALLSAAMWYASLRTVVVLSVVAIGLVLAAHCGLSLWRGALFAAAALLVFPPLVGYLAHSRFSASTSGSLAQHQAKGLADPFGADSTAGAHVGLVVNAVAGVVHDPLGIGVGATSIAGGKYGGKVADAEADPGNVAVAGGVPGLIAYLAVVGLGIGRTYRLACRRRDPAALAALGIVMVTLLQWLSGGHYAANFWPWLLFGWVDGAGAASWPELRLGRDVFNAYRSPATAGVSSPHNGETP